MQTFFRTLAACVVLSLSAVCAAQATPELSPGDAQDHAYELLETLITADGASRVLRNCPNANANALSGRLRVVADQLRQHFKARAAQYRVPAARVDSLLANWTKLSDKMVSQAPPDSCSDGKLAQFEQAMSGLEQQAQQLVLQWGTQRDFAILME